MYEHLYKLITPEYDANGGYEAGFILLLKILKQVSEEPIFMLIVTSIIINVCNVISMYIFTKNGYFEKDIERYAAYMYRLAEKRIFLVDTDFPRLTRENIPVEVVNARYDLSLSAIDSHRI